MSDITKPLENHEQALVKAIEREQTIDGRIVGISRGLFQAIITAARHERLLSR